MKTRTPTWQPDVVSLTAELTWLRSWTRRLEEELLRLRLEAIAREKCKPLKLILPTLN